MSMEKEKNFSYLIYIIEQIEQDGWENKFLSEKISWI